MRRHYLHFITKPYSFSVIQALTDEINRNNWGKSLIFLPDELQRLYQFKTSITSSLAAAVDFQPDAVFVPGNIVHDRIPGLKVQVFHGLCEEKGGHYKISGFFDLYCTSGPLITRKFEMLAEKHRHFQVAETGWPKVDLLLKPYERDDVFRKIGLQTNKKIILYAPTFSPKFKSSDKLFPLLPAVIRENETWIIKFHDLMDKKDKLRFKQLESDSIRVWEHSDNIPLLQAADVLISDTSSIVYEFMLLDKPVITIDAGVRLEKGINIGNIDQLRNAVDRSIADPKEFSRNRQRVLREIQPYTDHANAARVLKATEAILSSSIHAILKRKPLNLFRKYKVRKMFNYWG
jgi:hypothetical protein